MKKSILILLVFFACAGIRPVVEKEVFVDSLSFIEWGSINTLVDSIHFSTGVDSCRCPECYPCEGDTVGWRTWRVLQEITKPEPIDELREEVKKIKRKLGMFKVDCKTVQYLKCPTPLPVITDLVWRSHEIIPLPIQSPYADCDTITETTCDTLWK